MAPEDLREPLMSEEERSLEKVDWEYLTGATTVQHNNKAIKQSLLYTLVILPWILLAVLGFWAWNSSLRYKSRWYVRPDLVYSKSSRTLKGLHS